MPRPTNYTVVFSMLPEDTTTPFHFEYVTSVNLNKTIQKFRKDNKKILFIFKSFVMNLYFETEHPFVEEKPKMLPFVAAKVLQESVERKAAFSQELQDTIAEKERLIKESQSDSLTPLDSPSGFIENIFEDDALIQEEPQPHLGPIVNSPFR